MRSLAYLREHTSFHATTENYDTVMCENFVVKAANLTVRDFILTPEEEVE
ncbi:MAG: hypothetical protein V2I34_09320 [Bacteroidales bacterium]|jgi:hypothetical protein|nr:hypothetical protein [Bacteroidales bacterium]